jgi:hypothetical protein
MDQKQIQTPCCLQETYFTSKDKDGLNVKEGRNDPNIVK